MDPFEITGKIKGKIHVAVIERKIQPETGDLLLEELEKLSECISDYATNQVEAAMFQVTKYKKMTAGAVE